MYNQLENSEHSCAPSITADGLVLRLRAATPPNHHRKLCPKGKVQVGPQSVARAAGVEKDVQDELRSVSQDTSSRQGKQAGREPPEETPHKASSVLLPVPSLMRALAEQSEKVLVQDPGQGITLRAITNKSLPSPSSTSLIYRVTAVLPLTQESGFPRQNRRKAWVSEVG